MKYMKLFESKEEDEEIIDALEICFQDLKDKGFQVKIKQGEDSKIDFSDGLALLFNNM